MKKISLAALAITIALSSLAQNENSSKQNEKSSKSKFGIKAGFNHSSVAESKSAFDTRPNYGYMFSAFFSPTQRNGIGYRSEFVYSREQYRFNNDGKNTDVKNDYLYMPHLMTFTIAKLVQLQAGGQVGILLNAKTSGSKDSSITGLMNRFNYGLAGGVEVYPFKGLIVGARYNLSLGKMYKDYSQTSSATPYPLPFDPSKTNLKNGVLQLFIGYRF